MPELVHASFRVHPRTVFLANGTALIARTIPELATFALPTGSYEQGDPAVGTVRCPLAPHPREVWGPSAREQRRVPSAKSRCSYDPVDSAKATSEG